MARRFVTLAFALAAATVVAGCAEEPLEPYCPEATTVEYSIRVVASDVSGVVPVPDASCVFGAEPSAWATTGPEGIASVERGVCPSSAPRTIEVGITSGSTLRGPDVTLPGWSNSGYVDGGDVVVDLTTDPDAVPPFAVAHSWAGSAVSILWNESVDEASLIAVVQGVCPDGSTRTDIGMRSPAWVGNRLTLELVPANVCTVCPPCSQNGCPECYSTTTMAHTIVVVEIADETGNGILSPIAFTMGW